MRRGTVVLLFALLTLHLAALSARDRQLAIRLNDQGYDLYEDGRYSEALEKFDAARQADDSYLYGNYNFACTAAILIRQDSSRWGDLRESAFAALSRTVELRRSYRNRMLTDLDLTELRKEFRFYAIAGFDVGDPQDTAYLLQNLRWYGGYSSDGAGQLRHTCGVDFYSDGSCEFWFFTPRYLESSDSRDLYRVQGRYRVAAGGKISLALTAPMARRTTVQDILKSPAETETRTRFQGSLSPSGILQFDLFEYAFRSVP